MGVLVESGLEKLSDKRLNGVLYVFFGFYMCFLARLYLYTGLVVKRLIFYAKYFYYLKQSQIFFRFSK